MRQWLANLSIAALLFAAPANAAGDAQAATDRVDPGFRGVAKGARIVVLPVVVADPRYSAGRDRVEAGLMARLAKDGFAPIALKDTRFDRYWPEIVRQVEATAEPQDRGNAAIAHAREVATMARVVAGDPELALTISPVVVVRVVPLDSDFTTWDGVRRSPPLVIKDGMKTWMRWAHGTGVGLSLQLTGFGEGGRWAFTTFGGMTLPGQPNVDTKQVTIRTDLFEDADEIDEGVRVALRPLQAR